MKVSFQCVFADSLQNVHSVFTCWMDPDESNFDDEDTEGVFSSSLCRVFSVCLHHVYIVYYRWRTRERNVLHFEAETEKSEEKEEITHRRYVCSVMHVISVHILCESWSRLPVDEGTGSDSESVDESTSANPANTSNQTYIRGPFAPNRGIYYVYIVFIECL